MSLVADTGLEDALDRLASAAGGIAHGTDLRDALQAIAEASAAATGAELAVVRILDPADGQLTTAGVAGTSRARAAEVEGTRFPADQLADEEVNDLERLPEAVRSIAERSRYVEVLQLPISVEDGRPIASLELLRAEGRFGPAETALARLAASHVALCLRTAGTSAVEGRRPPADLLELAGEALAASADQADPVRLAALAAGTWGADAAYLWRDGLDAPPVLVGAAGHVGDHDAARDLAGAGLRSGSALVLDRAETMLPTGYALSAVVPLGRPAAGALQLLFTVANVPPDSQLARLTAFGAQAGRALRAGERSRALTVELKRSRALLGVLRRATAELSLAHTLATALERIASLLGIHRVAVYLRDAGTLQSAAGQGLTGPHSLVASRLLEVALGPGRGGGALAVENARSDPRLEDVRQAVEETGIEGALAAPLVANEEVIGLLAAYPDQMRSADEHELGLLAALASHVAVAVQNARLHERAKELGTRLEEALAAESAERRRLDGLYDVSRSFAQSLSLDTTLEAVTRAAVESLGVDAAVLRVPDSRGEALITQAVHVSDRRLEEALTSMLSRAQVISPPALRRFFQRAEPLHLDRASARALGGSFELLIPFLEKGSTAVVIPLATPDEVLATLTLISLDPEDPIDDETLAAALSLSGQAALAIDNARLYQQQKQFADSMQRSLLPRGRPEVPGLEMGIVYESSARMDVGGDLYDFLVLDDGRLALVLGDVTGHGVDAAADMAMAKFVFRSLAREHPEPADLLAHANDVVAEEIALGKFITLLYLTLDPSSGEIAGAAAGHSPPRILAADGTVSTLPVSGLALGVESGQAYEEARRILVPGDAVVLFTDGVIEARRDGELYGDERLEAFLAAHRDRSAQTLAEGLVEECRRFGGGELADDCAVVVLRVLAARSRAAAAPRPS